MVDIPSGHRLVMRPLLLLLTQHYLASSGPHLHQGCHYVIKANSVVMKMNISLASVLLKWLVREHAAIEVAIRNRRIINMLTALHV